MIGNEMRLFVEPQFSNCSWSAESQAAQVTVNPPSGVGAGEVVVTVDPSLTVQGTPTIQIAIGGYVLQLKSESTSRIEGVCDLDGPWWRCFRIAIVIIGSPFEQDSSFPKV
jgi:hypothetical protein